MDMSFYRQPWFIYSSVAVGGVVCGVALTVVYNKQSRNWDLSKKSYEALEKAYIQATASNPNFDGLNAEFKKVRDLCKKNDKVVRLLNHLDTIKTLGQYAADPSVGLTDGQKALLAQACKEVREIFKEKLPKS